MRNEFSHGKEERVYLTYLRQHVRRSDNTMIPLPSIKVMLQVFEEFNLARCKFLGDGFVAEIIPFGCCSVSFCCSFSSSFLLILEMTLNCPCSEQ